MSPPVVQWSLVVPVKRLALAKTRLGGMAGMAGMAGQLRGGLALAFALDTVAAALTCDPVGTVFAVTDDDVARSALTALGAQVVPDTPDAGLNPALAHGAEVARARHPGRSVGALSADLPALRPGELGRALRAAASHPAAFVSDAAGTGTTLLAVRAGQQFSPQFGARSRARHRAAGVIELDLADVPTLRRDVDTAVDLYDAERLGVGGHTAAVMAAIRSSLNRPG
jgi:2-phospho-L-lactate guanylyltransferase